MAGHAHRFEQPADRIRLRGSYGMLIVIGIAAAFAAGLPMGFLSGGTQRFLFSYLTGWLFFLTMALGALFSVVVHHASRAGWNVTVRRTSENIAATLPILCVLSIPLLVSILHQKGTIYRWAIPPHSPALTNAEEGGEHAKEGGKNGEMPKQIASEKGLTEGDEFPPTAEETAAKRKAEFANGPVFEPGVKWKREGGFAWYSNTFFLLRMLIYFGSWSGMALWFRKLSIEQDQSGDANLTARMQAFAPVGLVILGLSITFFAFDFVMSLDPHWFSTMFGVYFIVGGIVSGFATIIITLILLQSAGYLSETVSVEHYHDLGKYLFGFTFFWGYIAFGQYMLLWYSSIPEEVSWYSRHGATTLHPSRWSWVIVSLLFGQFAIPFLGLLSRHVKRNRYALCFWAIWVVCFHLVDVYWMVMPEYGGLHVALADLGCVLLVGGIFLATLVFNMSRANLRATHDPRLAGALAFVNPY